MTNEKFQELLQKAIKICSDCGYDTKNIKTPCYCTKKSCYGRCRWVYEGKDKPLGARIYVNKNLVENGTEKQVTEVLLHECLHGVFGQAENHGKEWTKAAKNINSIYGYNLNDRNDYFDKDGKFIDPRIYAPYVIQCTKCGFKDYYYSKCKIVKNYDNGKYHCPDCGNNHFTLSFREEFL